MWSIDFKYSVDLSINLIHKILFDIFFINWSQLPKISAFVQTRFNLITLNKHETSTLNRIFYFLSNDLQQAAD